MSTNPSEPNAGAPQPEAVTPQPNAGAEPVYGPAYSAATPGSAASASAENSPTPPPPAAYPHPPYGEPPRYTAPYPPYPTDDIPSAPGIAPNLAAGLAYVTVFPAIVFLLLEPYRSNPLVRFHSWQSVFYFVAVAVFRVIEMMLLSTLPASIAYAIAGLVSLVLFLGWLVAVIKALQGNVWQLPVVGKYAARTSASSSLR